MGRFVIAAFKPKPGMAQQLDAVVEKHWSVLRAENLVTDTPRQVMRAVDGTLIEVFEWLSPEAIERAHGSSVVHALWAEFAEVCEYIPLSNLAESRSLFAEFDSVRF